jgi:lipopolysaccharide/colanic/teichoic acid biosynthesis glycosyltransferase
VTIAIRPGSNAVLTHRSTSSGSGRLDVLVRYRFQLLGAVIIGVLVPGLVRIGIAGDFQPSISSAEITLIGALISILIGFAVLRRLMAYPGIWALSFVLPSFTFSYLLTILVFFFARIDYARLEFALSFALVVAWFYAMLIVERRVRPPRLFLLPFGSATRLTEMRGANWFVAPASIQLTLPLETAPDQSPPDKRRAGLPELLPSGINGVVADLRADLPPVWEEFLATCALRGVPVYHSKQIKESLSGTVEIEHLSENTLGSLIPSPLYRRFKRVLDVVLAVLLLPVFLIVGAFVAVAIKLDDGGQVLFRQQRVGYRGSEFTILKFRTMRERAEAGELFTLEGDDRITRAGRWLRLYRLDELPQILNILRGDMSWIGPRPEAVQLSQWYASKIPFYVYRHIVRPGITGWAAVNQGNVAELRGATGKLHYDFFYIKNFSPWLDLLIAVRTVTIVMTGFGSR